MAITAATGLAIEPKRDKRDEPISYRNASEGVIERLNFLEAIKRLLTEGEGRRTALEGQVAKLQMEFLGDG
ncbi:hypothetical protein TNCV_2357961 [Trichonephila clavipes]|nr:hypothetical protein TNCV_2357961 [Trichonephila clavipes]